MNAAPPESNELATGIQEILARLESDPQLMEDAVFTFVRDTELEEEYHAARDSCYRLEDIEARDRAFSLLNCAWFARLELASPAACALAERAEILPGVDRAILAPAVRRIDECAELFVRSADWSGAAAGRPWLVMRVHPESFKHPEHVRNFLRHELMHVRDMLDSDFEYSPQISQFYDEKGVPTLIRDRYRVLWDTYIDGRLVREERAEPGIKALRMAEFRKCFQPFAADHSPAFLRIFNADTLTHPELLAVAREPRRLFG